jgi:4-hydroxy-tetrahydrodipicolinate synthase
MSKPIRGVITALVTPMDSTGAIDWKAWDALISDQLAARVAGIIPCGTTGESPTLGTDEKKTLIESAVKACRGTSTAVIAGTGSNDTPRTIELSRWASDAGADGVLIVTPYYNKPSQTGLLKHFTAVADAVKCPVVLYNVPGRTGVGIAPEIVAQLAAHPRIGHIKEATGKMEVTSEILDHCSLAGTAMSVLSGDDATWLPLLSIGAEGVISVASNLFPRAMVQLQDAWNLGDARAARAIHERFHPLFRDLFVESNPVPIKTALAWVGLGSENVRAPLCGLADPSRKKLLSSLVRAGFTEKGGTL